MPDLILQLGNGEPIKCLRLSYCEWWSFEIVGSEDTQVSQFASLLRFVEHTDSLQLAEVFCFNVDSCHHFWWSVAVVRLWQHILPLLLPVHHSLALLKPAFHTVL